jgi:general secretion pathway protein J
MMRTMPRDQGFTLLELLLVVMLLAILLAGAYGGISAAVRGMHSGEVAIERVDKIRTVQEFLRHQISRILPFPYAQSKDGTTAEVFRGDGKFMRFVAPMPGYLSRGGSYVQTLELASGKDGMQLVFTSTLLNGFSMDKSKSNEESTVVLLDHIQDGTFRYRGLNPQGDLMNWSENWKDSSTTPLMVGLDLRLTSGGQIYWPQMMIPLMMDVGARRSAPMGLSR